MPNLPIDDVRAIARNCGLEEIYLNENSRVISFRSSSRKRTYDDIYNASATRFNVNYTTGTVGTILDHPRQGKTQLFRKNINLDLLQEIFLNPRIHTGYGYQNKNTSNNKRMRSDRVLDDNDVNVLEEDDEENEDMDEESAAKQLMVKLLSERDAIDEGIKEVQAILDEHERVREEQRRREKEERRRKAEEEERLIEKITQEVMKVFKKKAEEEKLRRRRARGQNGLWRGLQEPSDFSRNFTSDATCIAVGGKRHLCLYENGTWAYSSGLTAKLIQKLRTRALSHPSPTYVAMSNDDRFYIRFANGKSVLAGPTKMVDLLENTSREVRSLAFGENFNDYFVVFEDGYWEASGCPEGLSAKLDARQKRADLDRVSLGPNGEWFLRARNGRAWWGNACDTLMNKASEITNEGGNITDIQFGDTGTWFIRYK